MSNDAAETPTVVARTFFAAVARSSWLDAAECIDPPDRQLQYDAALAIVSQGKQPEIEVYHGSPGQRAGPTVIHRVLLQGARQPLPWASLGVATIEELRSLSATELMARIIETRERHFLERQRQNPGLAEHGSDPKWRSVGHALQAASGLVVTAAALTARRVQTSAARQWHGRPRSHGVNIGYVLARRFRAPA